MYQESNMLKMPLKPSFAEKVIQVGARSSPLSRVQVEEVLAELRVYHPEIEFQTAFMETVGDKDQNTSLRNLGKSDFFTREVDSMILQGRCRLGIHSAKDLPDPLPKKLTVIALTKGVDSSDALILRDGETLESLIPKGKVATSSERREESVLKLFEEKGCPCDASEALCTFVDIRGTIGQRLAKLDQGEVDAVVIAEAALIRLGLTGLSRFTLPGETVEGQGKLAIVAHIEDREMEELFRCIDSRVVSL